MQQLNPDSPQAIRDALSIQQIRVHRGTALKCALLAEKRGRHEDAVEHARRAESFQTLLKQRTAHLG
jgi:hypothetical protein